MLNLWTFIAVFVCFGRFRYSDADCLYPGVPANGVLSPPPNNVTTYIPGSHVEFSCNSGYTLVGNKHRYCILTGQWTGSQPYCKEPICSAPAIDHGSVVGGHCEIKVGSSIKFTCNRGYKLLGNTELKCLSTGQWSSFEPVCTDINECLEKNGLCSDTCENTVGSYECSCKIPGYKLAEDGHTCIVYRQCRSLTSADAPANGGLVCHWFKEENSQQCVYMCNDGYEIPSRMDAYETCGPTTGYIWSFQSKNHTARLPDCIPQFFEGFRMEADSSYFPGRCNNLTVVQNRETHQNFKQTLDGNGICKSSRNTNVCYTKDMKTLCGK